MENLFALFPETSNHQSFAGLGLAKLACAGSRAFAHLVFQLLCLVRELQVAPMQWHCSQAFSLPKKNQADVEHPFDSQRTIHTLDAIGKAFYNKNVKSYAITTRSSQ